MANKKPDIIVQAQIALRRKMQLSNPVNTRSQASNLERYLICFIGALHESLSPFFGLIGMEKSFVLVKNVSCVLCRAVALSIGNLCGGVPVVLKLSQHLLFADRQALLCARQLGLTADARQFARNGAGVLWRFKPECRPLRKLLAWHRQRR